MQFTSPKTRLFNLLVAVILLTGSFTAASLAAHACTIDTQGNLTYCPRSDHGFPFLKVKAIGIRQDQENGGPQSRGAELVVIDEGDSTSTISLDVQGDVQAVALAGDTRSCFIQPDGTEICENVELRAPTAFVVTSESQDICTRREDDFAGCHPSGRKLYTLYVFDLGKKRTLTSGALDSFLVNLTSNKDPAMHFTKIVPSPDGTTALVIGTHDRVLVADPLPPEGEPITVVESQGVVGFVNLEKRSCTLKYIKTGVPRDIAFVSETEALITVNPQPIVREKVSETLAPPDPVFPLVRVVRNGTLLPIYRADAIEETLEIFTHVEVSFIAPPREAIIFRFEEIIIEESGSAQAASYWVRIKSFQQTQNTLWQQTNHIVALRGQREEWREELPLDVGYLKVVPGLDAHSMLALCTLAGSLPGAEPYWLLRSIALGSPAHARKIIDLPLPETSEPARALDLARLGDEPIALVSRDTGYVFCVDPPPCDLGEECPPFHGGCSPIGRLQSVILAPDGDLVLGGDSRSPLLTHVEGVPTHAPAAEASAPVAILHAEPTSGDEPLEVHFDLTTVSETPIAVSEFDPGDGTEPRVWNGPPPEELEHTYRLPPCAPEEHCEKAEIPYIATLKATSIEGKESAPAKIEITVKPTPVAHLDAEPLEGTSPLAVRFDWSKSSGEDLTATIDFGDGSELLELGNRKTVNHLYRKKCGEREGDDVPCDAVGFDAVLKIKDHDGRTASDSVTINLTPQVNAKPTLNLRAPEFAVGTKARKFLGTIRDADDQSLDLLIVLSSDVPPGDNQPDPFIYYVRSVRSLARLYVDWKPTRPGNYTFTVSAEDPFGAVTQTTLAVKAFSQGPYISPSPTEARFKVDRRRMAYLGYASKPGVRPEDLLISLVIGTISSPNVPELVRFNFLGRAYLFARWKPTVDKRGAWRETLTAEAPDGSRAEKIVNFIVD